MGPLSLYFSLAYWVYPMKNIIGESGCYISFYWQTIGSFGILLQSFFVATFRYICLLHEDFLLGFSLSPTVSTLFSPLNSFLPWKISTHLYIYCHQPEKLQHSFLCIKLAFIITFQALKSENSLFLIQMISFVRLRNPIHIPSDLLLFFTFSDIFFWLLNLTEWR